MPQTAEAVSDPTLLIFDISLGDITIVDGGPGLIDVTYDMGTITVGTEDQLTIIGSTAVYSVYIADDVRCHITLDNVSIDTRTGGMGVAPFHIADDTAVYINLIGQNTFIADADYAGLLVENYGMVVIDGPGGLKSEGGPGGAGIGGEFEEDTGTIFINGGIIEAIGGIGAAGIGGGSCDYSGFYGDFTLIYISDSAFIKSALGGTASSADDIGGGAGIGKGGSGGPVTPPGYSSTGGTIIISSGIDLARVQGGAADGTWTAGAAVGTGGGDDEDAISYDLHTITYHNNEVPDIMQALTYTINGNKKSDAVLPTLGFVQMHNPSFVSSRFDDLWYETPLGFAGAHGIGIALRLTSITDLYAYGVDREPKMGL
jgi:hypothetical protein